MRRLGRALAVCVLSAAGATGCGSVVSTVFTDVGQAVPELPPACESAIAEFLVAEQSRVAWLSSAARVAPGSAGYVDYTFPSD